MQLRRLSGGTAARTMSLRARGLCMEDSGLTGLIHEATSDSHWIVELVRGTSKIILL
jgi:hypothetical protein